MTFVRLCIALEQQASSVTPATWNRQQHPAEACRLPGLVATAGCTNTAMANSMVPPILTFLTGWPNDKINGRFCTFTHSHTATAIHDCQSTAARAHHAPPSQPKALLPPQVALGYHHCVVWSWLSADPAVAHPKTLRWLTLELPG